MHQIASLRTALARKEEEPKRTPPSVSMSSEQCRKKTSADASSFNHTQLKQKRQSFDLDELLGNSPPFPPIPGQVYREDEKESGLGDWEDKVMLVNKKQDGGASLGCWEPDNANLSNMSKYLKDSPKVLPEQTFSMFMGINGFNAPTADDADDDLDAATSDSSEHNSLWQFNHSKLNVMANGVGLKSTKSLPKPAKSPDLR